VWLLRRRADVPLRAPNGIAVEGIDGTLLELARSLHVSREHSPERQRQRAQEQAAAAQRAEHAKLISERYGSEEVMQGLLRREPGRQIGGDHFVNVVEQQEFRRRTACDAMALEYRPLRIEDATPEWWKSTGGPDTPHLVRYRALVAKYANPNKEGK
jgi:hypothetical protein